MPLQALALVKGRLLTSLQKQETDVSKDSDTGLENANRMCRKVASR